MSYVVAISGLSGCGKTTLAKSMVQAFGAVHLCLDNYYFATDPSVFSTTNFEDPAMIDSVSAARDIERLCQGEKVHSPIYDFTLCRAIGTQVLEPSPVIVVEGQYAGLYTTIRSVSHLLVLLDLDCQLCMERRILRDQQMLNRSVDESRARFEGTVLSTFTQYKQSLLETSHVRFTDGQVPHWIETIRRRWCESFGDSSGQD